MYFAEWIRSSFMQIFPKALFIFRVVGTQSPAHIFYAYLLMLYIWQPIYLSSLPYARQRRQRIEPNIGTKLCMFGYIHFAAQQMRQNGTAFGIPIRNNGTMRSLGGFPCFWKCGQNWHGIAWMQAKPWCIFVVLERVSKRYDWGKMGSSICSVSWATSGEFVNGGQTKKMSTVIEGFFRERC